MYLLIFSIFNHFLLGADVNDVLVLIIVNVTNRIYIQYVLMILNKLYVPVGTLVDITELLDIIDIILTI